MIPVPTLLSLKNDYKVRCQEIKDGDQYPFYSWCCKNVPGYKTLRGNLAFRKKILELAADNLNFKNDIYSMCGRDILFYINTFVFTHDPRLLDTPIIPFITYGFQDVAFDDLLQQINNKSDILAEKSRAMGASWIFLTAIEWLWHFKDGLSFLLGSRTEDYVDKSGEPKSLMWKIDALLKYLPRWLSPNTYRVYLHIDNLDNNSTIGGESTTGNFARGGRWTIIMLDEFAAVEPDGSKVLKATRDATKTRIFNSTHQGAATAFYRKSKGKIRKLIMHWSVHPLYIEGLYHSENGKLIRHDNFSGSVRMPEIAETFDFPEEYPFRLDGKLRSPWYDNECDRADHPMEIAQELDIDPFSSDFQFFDPAMIDEIEKEHVCHPFDEGEIEFDADSYEPLGFVHGVNGPLKLWIYPDFNNTIDRNMEIGCGGDISAGTGASNSVLQFVNLRTGEKIGEYANPWIRPAEFARLTAAYCNYFNNAFLVFDASGPTGRQFSDELMRIGYRNLYYRRKEEGLNKKVSDKPGVFLNTKERAAILGLYRRCLKDRTFIQRSSLANQECLEYIQKTSEEIIHSSAVNNIDPSGAGMSHGDRCIADCCAAKCIDFLDMIPKKNAVDDGNIPENCYAARERDREIKARKKEEW